MPGIQDIMNAPVAMQAPVHPSGMQNIIPLYTGDEAARVAKVLYAEAASDPEGWVPKLNTYYKAKRGGESFANSVERKSSAFRRKDPQYQLAGSSKMNAYEKNVYNKLLAQVSQFKPDPTWDYEFHESPDFYKDDNEMLQKLAAAWGQDVDFKNRKKIGKEYYFKKVKKNAR